MKDETTAYWTAAAIIVVLLVISVSLWYVATEPTDTHVGEAAYIGSTTITFTKRPCEYYSDYRLDQVPARCHRYFTNK